MPMNAASVVLHGTDHATGVGRHRQSGALDLARTGVAPELGGELDHLGDAGGAERVAPGHQAAARVDRHARPADGGVAGHRGRPGVAGLEEARATRGRRAPRRWWRRAARRRRRRRGRRRRRPRRPRPSRPGGRGSRCRRCPSGRCWPGSAGPRSAAAVDRTTAAAPSVNDEHMSRVRGETMDGDVEHLLQGDLGLELGVGVEGPVTPGLDRGGRELLERSHPAPPSGRRSTRR